jgi:hypothetical protein
MNITTAAKVSTPGLRDAALLPTGLSVRLLIPPESGSLC